MNALWWDEGKGVSGGVYGEVITFEIYYKRLCGLLYRPLISDHIHLVSLCLHSSYNTGAEFVHMIDCSQYTF